MIKFEKAYGIGDEINISYNWINPTKAGLISLRHLKHMVDMDRDVNWTALYKQYLLSVYLETI